MLPVLLQVTLAEGLRRGRRAAWVAAVALGTVLTAIGGIVVVTVLHTPADSLPLLDARPGSLPAVSVLAPLVAPLAVLVLLLLTRADFGVRAAPGAARRWLVAGGLGLATVTALYVGLGSLMGRDFARAPSVAALLADLPAADAAARLPRGGAGAAGAAARRRPAARRLGRRRRLDRADRDGGPAGAPEGTRR